MSKNKSCLGCNKLFTARKDAKTCSSRCRKRLERNRRLFALEINAKPAYRPYWKLGFGSSSASQVTYVPARLAKSRLKKKLSGCKRNGIAVIALFLIFALHAGKTMAVAEGYTTYDSGLKQGMTVELTSQSTQSLKVVDRATFDNPSKVLGVSVGIDDSLLTSASPSSKVFVSNSGNAQAYVSDVNGQVKQGDLLSVSPLNGILMKNTDASQGVVGSALADFPANFQTVSAHKSDGSPVETKVALMPINVNLVLPGTANGNDWLSQAGRSITGRDIAPTRLLAAASIFMVILVVEGSIVFSTISKSITAIGRNPLAGKMVRAEAVHSFGLAVIFLLVGSSVISIILWL